LRGSVVRCSNGRAMPSPRRFRRPFSTLAVSIVAAAVAFLGSDGVAQTPWIDATAASGLGAPVGAPFMGRGCAVEDFDGDGDFDVIMGDGSVGGTLRVFLNQGGAVFVDVGPRGLGLEVELKGLAAGDVDGDGDLDLFVCRRWLGASLYLNDGAANFTDVTTAAGIPGPPVPAVEYVGCTFVDYDLDGILDVAIARRQVFGTAPSGSPNILLRGVGGGLFTVVPGAAGTAGTFMSFLVDACDWDDDGDPDFLVCDDYGGLYSNSGLGQVLWRNDGFGVFTDQTAAYGVTTPIAAMGCAWGDIDRDGDFDYFLTNDFRGHVLGINQLSTTGTFPDMAVAWGVIEYEIGWGCLFFDYDADGFVDLYVAQKAAGPSRMFRNNAGVPPMTDVGAALGLALLSPTLDPDCVAADFDDDGDLDLFEPLAGTSGRLMLNPGLNGANWLKVKPIGRASNRSAIGARVKVMAAGAPRIDAVRGRTAYLSSGPLETYHGLGASTSADLVEIRWPSGAWTSIPGPVPSNQKLTVEEPILTTTPTWALGSIRQATLDCPGEGGLFGVIVLSADPTPSPLGDGRMIPITLDVVSDLCLLTPSPIIGNNLGPLSASGTRTAYVYVPNLPSLSGLVLHVAGATIDAAAPMSVRSLTPRKSVVLL
jgi:enediyne biosynthesis protein E4